MKSQKMLGSLLALLVVCVLGSALTGCDTPILVLEPNDEIHPHQVADDWSPTTCTYTPVDPNNPGTMMVFTQFPGDPSEDRDLSACHHRACLAGLLVHVEQESWPKGRYKLVADTEWGRTECKVPMPDYNPAPCFDEGGDASTTGEPLPACRTPEVLDSLDRLWFFDAPRQVHIQIFYEGKQIADEQFEPTYTTVRWDGYQCPDICEYNDAFFIAIP